VDVNVHFGTQLCGPRSWRNVEELRPLRFFPPSSTNIIQDAQVKPEQLTQCSLTICIIQSVSLGECSSESGRHLCSIVTHDLVLYAVIIATQSRIKIRNLCVSKLSVVSIKYVQGTLALPLRIFLLIYNI